MKVLLDVGVSPRLRVPLESALGGTPVESAVFHRWRTLRNGELLELAHREGFTTLLTTDKRFWHRNRRVCDSPWWRWTTTGWPPYLAASMTSRTPSARLLSVPIRSSGSPRKDSDHRTAFGGRHGFSG